MSDADDIQASLEQRRRQFEKEQAERNAQKKPEDVDPGVAPIKAAFVYREAVDAVRPKGPKGFDAGFAQIDGFIKTNRPRSMSKILDEDALIGWRVIGCVQNPSCIRHRIVELNHLSIDRRREAIPLAGVGFSFNVHDNLLWCESIRLTNNLSLSHRPRLRLSTRAYLLRAIHTMRVKLTFVLSAYITFSSMIDPIYKQIGAVIKSRRKTLEMKQETLAGLLGISRGSLANVETGRQGILVHQLYKFAVALQLKTPADLLPHPSSDHLRTERTELPLPRGLKTQEKEQITRFFEQVDTKQIHERKGKHAKSKSR